MNLISPIPELTLIPEFNGNRDLPPDEQVRINFHRIPGTSEKKKFNNFRFDSSASVYELVNNDNIMCQTFIRAIDNLSINGKKIKNGGDLAVANCPKLENLFNEIRDHLFPPDEELTTGESEA